MKIKYIAPAIAFIITVLVLKLIKHYRMIVVNKLAMTQLSNNNNSYVMHQFVKNNYGLINITVILIAIIFTVLIIRKKGW